MKRVLVITRKEIRELLKNKGTLIFGLGYALFFSILAALGIKKTSEAITAEVILNTALFYLPLVIGILIVYTSTGQIFFREKQEKIIETLLCAPISLRRLWLGKVLGAAAPSYLMSILSAILIILLSNIFLGSSVVPSVIIIPHLLIAVPLFIAAVAGLIGFVYLLLGMREIRIISIIILMAILGALFGGLKMIGSGFAVSWLLEGILLITSLLLVAFTTYLTKYLSKEKIVTTIS